ncbi:hypothetical protein BDR22DRAFT_336729 [Usnea florida]
MQRIWRAHFLRNGLELFVGLLSGTSSQPDPGQLMLPRNLLVSTICPVIDVDSLWICYRYMTRLDPHRLSMFCVELNARSWHILSPDHGGLLDAGDTCQSWSGNLAESIAIPDEANIKAG